jgi:hypothetical protein
MVCCAGEEDVAEYADVVEDEEEKEEDDDEDDGKDANSSATADVVFSTVLLSVLSLSIAPRLSVHCFLLGYVFSIVWWLVYLLLLSQMPMPLNEHIYNDERCNGSNNKWKYTSESNRNMQRVHSLSIIIKFCMYIFLTTSRNYINLICILLISDVVNNEL